MTPKTIILADGTYPEHEIPLEYIRNAERIVCCDGSAEKLVNQGVIPDAIVGDLDTLPEYIVKKFPGRVFRIREQETNDLTKAFNWCINKDYRDIVILGATGKREDHTLGNISLLGEYAKEATVIMVTDTGIFRPLTESSTLDSFPGQQVSVFCVDPGTMITSIGLKYPLRSRKLQSWWTGTLNEATGMRFSLEFSGGPVIVYLQFPGSSS